MDVLVASLAARSEGIVLRLGLDGDPAQIGELGDAGLAAEAAVARSLHAAERHLRFVMYGRAVDVADAAFDPLRHRQRTRDVSAEYGGRKAILGVVGEPHGVVHATCA